MTFSRIYSLAHSPFRVNDKNEDFSAFLLYNKFFRRFFDFGLEIARKKGAAAKAAAPSY